MKPRTEAIAFRIWAYCEAFGWAQTMAEIPEALDLSVQTVSNVLIRKGWVDRVRRVPQRKYSNETSRGGIVAPTLLDASDLRYYGLDPSVRE